MLAATLKGDLWIIDKRTSYEKKPPVIPALAGKQKMVDY